MASKLFVGNLDFSATREDIESLFTQVGPVVDVFLPSDRTTGRPRGFAFVEFESADHAAQAIQRFDGHELKGRPLRVNAAEDRPVRTPSFGAGPSPFGGAPRGGFPSKPKGSRRNVRARKRSL
jgi:RNA recognition motif-containing protein